MRNVMMSLGILGALLSTSTMAVDVMPAPTLEQCQMVYQKHLSAKQSLGATLTDGQGSISTAQIETGKGNVNIPGVFVVEMPVPGGANGSAETVLW